MNGNIYAQTEDDTERDTDRQMGGPILAVGIVGTCVVVGVVAVAFMTFF